MEFILKLFKKQEPVISTEENPIDYKYQEDRILKELAEYIDNTYDQFIIPKTNIKQQNLS